MEVRDQVRAQLEAVGLTVDEARLEALLPVHGGLLHGMRRLASLDLGEAEPATVFTPPQPATAQDNPRHDP